LPASIASLHTGLFSEHLAWSTHDTGFFNDLLPVSGFDFGIFFVVWLAYSA
jgi:uncharacterized protein